MQPIPRIPGYELYEVLGGGPLTVVYRARDERTDRVCAVKLLRDDWKDDSIGIKLLQREARAGLSVRHPHLVHVQYAQVTHPPYFLVMNLLRGESLQIQLRRNYRLAVGESLSVIRQIAQALAALHSAGFLHGDVKPDNVRLIEDGTAVLIDLGFAHRPGENAAFLREGYVLGTANYLAPELCDPQPSEDTSSDMFSLGVMLFEMLTGRLPYPAGSLSQTFTRHRCDPPADIRRSVRGLPVALVTILEQLLSHKAAGRPRAASIVQKLISLEIAGMRRRSA